MSKLLQLTKAHAAEITKATAIRDQAKAEKREITAEEEAAITAHLDAAAAIKADMKTEEQAQAKRRETLAALDGAAAELGKSVRKTAPDAGAPLPAQPKAEDDGKCGFRTPAEFFRAVIKAGSGRAEADPRLAPLAAVGSDEQRSDIDSTGGYLVPRGFSPNLLQLAAETDPTAGRTTMVPMETNAIDIPARVDKDHTSSVSGGLTWSRRAQTGTGADSKQAYELVTLKVNSLMAVNFQTEELIRDSAISVAALIAASFRQELGATMVNEKLNGTGSGQYLGVLNAPGKVVIAKESGQLADTINFQNVVKMRARCWGYGNAIWLANHDCYPQLAQLSLQVGVGGSAVYTPSLVEDRPDLLLGRPIFYTEYTKTVGDKGDLVLGNWSQYLEGQKGGMESAESIHVRFLQNERVFRAEVRNDGQPWWRTVMTPKNSTATMAPFVLLDDRA